MLQALRFVIQGAGSKVDPAIRKNITTTLLGMLGHDEVHTSCSSELIRTPHLLQADVTVAAAEKTEVVQRGCG